MTPHRLTAAPAVLHCNSGGALTTPMTLHCNSGSATLQPQRCFVAAPTSAPRCSTACSILTPPVKLHCSTTATRRCSIVSPAAPSQLHHHAPVLHCITGCSVETPPQHLMASGEAAVQRSATATRCRDEARRRPRRLRRSAGRRRCCDAAGGW